MYILRREQSVNFNLEFQRMESFFDESTKLPVTEPQSSDILGSKHEQLMPISEFKYIVMKSI